MNHCVTYWFYLLLIGIYSEWLVYIAGMEELSQALNRLSPRSLSTLTHINLNWRYPMNRYFLKFILAAGVALGLAACGGSDDPAPLAAPTKNIVQLAAGTPDLSTLVTAVTTAGLTTTLSGTTSYTVFAPTNAAFAKIPAATLSALLGATPPTTLTSILTYHVVPGKVLKAGISLGTPITTANGATLTINQVGNNFIITDVKGGTSTITATDILATNGVVHLIDTVIMP
jgi:uncharacterized surface protein with fasciclin (FAS1) repeats